MAKVDLLLEDYAAYHRTKGNKICHFIGIPLIICGILSMLRSVPVATITAAEILIAASFAYYLTLNFRLAISLLIAVVILDFVAFTAGRLAFGATAFVVGWIFQGIGHAVFEKKSPAFLKNLVHLLIGPIFLLNEMLHIRPAAFSTRTN